MSFKSLFICHTAAVLGKGSVIWSFYYVANFSHVKKIRFCLISTALENIGPPFFLQDEGRTFAFLISLLLVFP